MTHLTRSDEHAISLGGDDRFGDALRVPRLFLLLLLATLIPVSARAGQWALEKPERIASLRDDTELVRQQGVKDGRAVIMTVFHFSDRTCQPIVVANPDPANGTLAHAMRQAECIAGVNGGYFHDDLSPVGQVIAGGRTLGKFEKAKLLSGLIVVRYGVPSLLRSSEYDDWRAGVTEALQAGPFLIDGGVPVGGLENAKRARRTIVATDGRGRWELINMTSITLADAASLLDEARVPGRSKTARALNLDGGHSSAIWVDVPRKAFSLPEFNTVSNYLGIRPR